MSKLNQALQAINNAPAIGDVLRELSISIKEQKELQIESLKSVNMEFSKLNDKLNKKLKEHLERMDELEDSISTILESAMVSDLQTRLSALEELMTAPKPEVVEATQPKKTPLKRRKIAIFGCLPRQYQSLSEKLPHLDITHLKRPTKTTDEAIFVACTMAGKQDLQKIESANPNNTIRMQGALTSWINEIEQWLGQHPQS